VRCVRSLGIAALACSLCACTVLVRRDERETTELRPIRMEARRALRLEVVESEIAYMTLCFGGGRIATGVHPAEPVSAVELERHRRVWESTGLFARVVTGADAASAGDELAVRVRMVRDLAESDGANGLALLTLGLWPLLFGQHEDRLVSFDAAFQDRGELLGEITRVERLTKHGHLLLVPLAPFLGEERATASAERDLVHAILAEAQRRGIL
jgi:hypothetical protein